jgi:hypothetical protein
MWGNILTHIGVHHTKYDQKSFGFSTGNFVSCEIIALQVSDGTSYTQFVEIIIVQQKRYLWNCGSYGFAP